MSRLDLRNDHSLWFLESKPQEPTSFSADIIFELISASEDETRTYAVGLRIGLFPLTNWKCLL